MIQLNLQKLTEQSLIQNFLYIFDGQCFGEACSIVHASYQKIINTNQKLISSF